VREWRGKGRQERRDVAMGDMGNINNSFFFEPGSSMLKYVNYDTNREERLREH
jgi:hypothetical protein